MKILAAAAIGVFGILCIIFGLLQLYTLPIPSGLRYENIKLSIDRTLQTGWNQRESLARFLYRTVLRNGDKIVFFPPRITGEYDFKGRPVGYVVYGAVTAWDAKERLLTVSSYTGRSMSVRFDPSSYTQTAILPALDKHGSIITSKAIRTITSLPIKNIDTLFCPQDVIAIKTRTYQEILSASATRPLVPEHIRLTFRLCESTP
jgi:hypothetical protein